MMKYLSGLLSLTHGDTADFQCDSAGNLKTVIAAGDIEIGAVEIKDGAADIRQTVLAASTAAAATDKPAVVALHPSSIGKVGIDQTTPGTTDHVTTSPRTATLTTAITRPSDTNAYAANDAFANSTSAPTSGGFTFTSAGNASGGSGVITDAVISASAGSAYQGEIWIFDQAVTATNDNAALSVSDSDILNLVGVIPFNTTDVNAANAISYVNGLNIGYTCVGTANLRFLVKIMAAVTPASAEVLNIRLHVNN